MTFSRRFRYLRQYSADACDTTTGDGTVHALAAQLTMINPRTTLPDRDLLYAADIHLFLRDADEFQPDPLPWAVYAYRTAQDLHGPHHDVTLRLASRLAEFLYAPGDLPTAIDLRRLALAHSTTGTCLWARRGMDLAATLHKYGACAPARGKADAALAGWRPTDDGERLAFGGGLLIDRLRIADRCGDFDDAQRVLVTYQDLLPPQGHRVWEFDVFALYRLFGDPARVAVAAHRRVCGSSPSGPSSRPRTVSDQEITAVRDLLLNAIGYLPGVGLPGLQRFLKDNPGARNHPQRPAATGPDPVAMPDRRAQTGGAHHPRRPISDDPAGLPRSATGTSVAQHDTSTHREAGTRPPWLSKKPARHRPKPAPNPRRQATRHRGKMLYRSRRIARRHRGILDRAQAYIYTHLTAVTQRTGPLDVLKPVDRQQLQRALDLHAAGHCEQAHALAGRVWDHWQAAHQPGRRGAARAHRQQQFLAGVVIAQHRHVMTNACQMPGRELLVVRDAVDYLPRAFLPGRGLSRLFGPNPQPNPGDRPSATPHEAVCAHRRPAAAPPPSPPTT